VTTYTFDKAGNRATMTETSAGKATTTTYTYNDQNRLTSTVATDPTGVQKTVSSIYDNNGNLCSEMASTLGAASMAAAVNLSITDKDSAVYEYDAWNNMVKSATGGIVTTNEYNGDGQRVAKTTEDVSIASNAGSSTWTPNPMTVNYAYVYNDVILELDAAGAQLAYNVVGTNVISRTTGGKGSGAAPGKAATTTATLYFMYNGHGDVTAIVNGSAVVATYYSCLI